PPPEAPPRRRRPPPPCPRPPGPPHQRRPRPQLAPVLLGARRQPLAVRREGDRLDVALVPAEGAEQAAVAGVAQPQPAVVADRGEQPAVGGEGHVAHPEGVAGEDHGATATGPRLRVALGGAVVAGGAPRAPPAQPPRRPP